MSVFNQHGLKRFLTITTPCLALAGKAMALNVCGFTETMDFSGPVVFPYGAEYIGIGPAGGQIVGASYQVTFTATGNFDAADIGVFVELPIDGGAHTFGFTGAQLGWSGQGTFTASLKSDALNGYLNPYGNPHMTWFLYLWNLNLDNGPISGTFDNLVFTWTYAPCPEGDINQDASVNVDDLLAVISGWGQCPELPAECAADVTENGVVDVDDLLVVINNWAEFCPFCQ